jgi:ribosome-associated protein
MDIRKLQRAIVDGLQEVKAQNIEVFNTEHLSPLFERVIIASGTSNRQTKALASSVRETVKSRGMQVLRTEGEANGEWIIVDCGAAVAHIMQPAIRDYYHLEEIWGGKPVRMKLAETSSVARGAAGAVSEARAEGATRGAAPLRGSPAKTPTKRRARTTAKARAGKPLPQTAAHKARSGRAAGRGAAAKPRKSVGRSVGKKSSRSATKLTQSRKTSRRA